MPADQLNNQPKQLSTLEMCQRIDELTAELHAALAAFRAEKADASAAPAASTRPTDVATQPPLQRTGTG